MKQAESNFNNEKLYTGMWTQLKWYTILIFLVSLFLDAILNAFLSIWNFLHFLCWLFLKTYKRNVFIKSMKEKIFHDAISLLLLAPDFYYYYARSYVWCLLQYNDKVHPWDS